VHVGTGIPDGIARRLREIASTVDPALRVDDIQTLDEIYKYSSIPDIAAGLGIAGLTLGVVLFALACIYTLMCFTVVHRLREIGIRSALGASQFRLVAGIFRSVLLPVAVGVAVGGLAALPIGHYMSPMLLGEGKQPLPWILPATEMFLFLVAVISLHAPVRRALSVDPVEALRSE
jgi:ABC-type antimicrobial peptide transport system permease subunit